MANYMEGKHDIFEKVRDYYLSNLSTLPIRKQFHFLSRCYLWSHKNEYLEHLEQIREPWWYRFENDTKKLQALPELTVPPKYVKKQYRTGVVRKYFPVYEYNRFFFKCLYDKTIFNGNAITEYQNRINIPHLQSLRTALLKDEEALFTLSTQAMNFLYLSNYLLEKGSYPIDPEFLLQVGERVSLNKKSDDLDARVYFYTHAIIGVTHFYADKIPADMLPVYEEMLRRLEDLLEHEYPQLSLDHTCEFLVCAKLCEYKTKFTGIIHEDLIHSISPDGIYFVNTRNIHSQKRRKSTMAKMEHTNALALLAFLPQSNF